MFNTIKKFYNQVSRKYHWDGENWLKIFKNNNFIDYHLGDKLHRNDGPAEIWYFDNGNIKLKKYYINGTLHREDGPAKIRFHQNGNIYFEIYYKDGKLHRTNGPAYINNNIKRKIYYFKGIKFYPKKLPFDLPIDNTVKEFYFDLKIQGV